MFINSIVSNNFDITNLKNNLAYYSDYFIIVIVIISSILFMLSIYKLLSPIIRFAITAIVNITEAVLLIFHIDV